MSDLHQINEYWQLNERLREDDRERLGFGPQDLDGPGLATGSGVTVRNSSQRRKVVGKPLPGNPRPPQAGEWYVTQKGKLAGGYKALTDIEGDHIILELVVVEKTTAYVEVDLSGAAKTPLLIG